MSTPVLSLSRVSFSYTDGNTALRDVDLTIEPGETVVLLGASGAGKSTLCLTANGLVPQFVKGEFFGTVQVDGFDTREHAVRSFAPHVGIVFQDFESQLFCTSAELEAAFGPENLGLPPKEIRRRVESALEAVGLSGFNARFPAGLSGGEKQRLAVAAALALEPSLLVFDEPASDLDPAGREEVHSVARVLRDRRETALLIAEPDAGEALGADRLVVLERGAVVLQGPPGSVLRQVPELLAAGMKPPAAAEVTARLGLPVEIETAAAADRILAAGYRPRPLPAAAAEAQAGPDALTARGVGFSYPGRPPALRGIDLPLGRGEFVALLGRNGSGKTTLAKILAGILKPTVGRVDRGPGACVTGYVFQNPDHQIFAETVEAEVAFGPRLRGLPSAEVSARVEEALGVVGLQGFAARDPFLLSKGARQRVAVASVLAMRPDVLVLDEPTTGLDYQEIQEMMTLVARLHREGHTVVIVTHAMWVAARYASRTVVMEQGRVLADGPTREVFRREDTLLRGGLKPPDAVVLASRLGLGAMTPDEIVAGLEKT